MHHGTIDHCRQVRVSTHPGTPLHCRHRLRLHCFRDRLSRPCPPPQRSCPCFEERAAEKTNGHRTLFVGYPETQDSSWTIVRGSLRDVTAEN
jgi:hypothetical protein